MISFLLYLALRPIQPHVVVPAISISDRLKYLEYTPNLNSVLDILTHLESANITRPMARIRSPNNLPLYELISYMDCLDGGCINRAKFSSGLMMNDFLSLGLYTVSVNRAVRELRATLIRYLDRDNRIDKIDEFVLLIYSTLVTDIISVME